MDRKEPDDRGKPEDPRRPRAERDDRARPRRAWGTITDPPPAVLDPVVDRDD